MNQTKITLSEKELQLVTNADWILTKNGIIKKLRLLLEQLQVQQSELLDSYRDNLPAEVFSVSPKISKGENYKGLPYLILDQPRVFEKENIFAIRTLFWWGNLFSVTLHLSGKYKKLFEKKMAGAYKLLDDEGSYYCIQTDPWEHHFEETNYSAIGKMDAKKFRDDIMDRSFIKIARKWKLEEWENIDTRLSNYYKMLIEIIAS